MPSDSRRASWSWLGLLLGLVGCATARTAQPEPGASAPATGTPGVIAFVDVSVLQLDSERVLEGQTVVVRGEHIVAVGPAASTPVPEGALRIDGRGRFLMPGLVDMHIHLQPGEGALSDPAGQQLALLLANGVTTARALSAPPAAAALAERVARGEVFGPTLRIVPEAQAACLGASDHLTQDVGLLHAPAAVSDSPSLALAEIVASTGAVPELRTHRELRYVPSTTVDAWTKELLTSPMADAPVADKHRFLELRRQALLTPRSAGAPLLVGSDSPQLFLVPGFATHLEMEALAHAGLTPLAVLQAVTRNAAAFLGESNQWGSVAPGQRADLLLLNANPLRDVSLTRASAGVMAHGHWYPRGELDTRLEQVATAARAPQR